MFTPHSVLNIQNAKEPMARSYHLLVNASKSESTLVGRSPTFAYWRKVGYQTRTVFVQAATGIAVQSECSILMREIIT